jgi:hypothetical protein
LDGVTDMTVAEFAMRRIIKAPWTPEENERLKALAAGGTSALRAAAALNCSVLSVRNQARKLRCPFPSIREMKKRLAERERSTHVAN